MQRYIFKENIGIKGFLLIWALSKVAEYALVCLCINKEEVGTTLYNIKTIVCYWWFSFLHISSILYRLNICYI